MSEPTHGDYLQDNARHAAEQRGPSTLWTVAFWQGAGERAIKTAAQTLGAVILVKAGGDVIPAAGLEGIDWVTAFSVTGLATVLSVVMSIGNADFTAGVR